MLKYITAALLVLSLVLGFTTYKLMGEVATLEVSVQTYTDLANANANEVDNLKLSCSVTQQVVKDNRDTIDALQKSREATLGALNALPLTTLPETQQNGKETSTESIRKTYSDDSRLSPALMQLLDTAYCSGSKNDSACTAR